MVDITPIVSIIGTLFGFLIAFIIMYITQERTWSHQKQVDNEKAIKESKMEILRVITRVGVTFNSFKVFIGGATENNLRELRTAYQLLLDSYSKNTWILTEDESGKMISAIMTQADILDTSEKYLKSALNKTQKDIMVKQIHSIATNLESIETRIEKTLVNK